MIELEAATVVLDGQTVLDGVTLTVPERTLLALIGPSGAGKSVLLRAVCGLLPLASGEIRVDGEPIAGRDEEALFGIRARIGMLFQGGALFDTLTVFENVAFPLRRRRQPEAGIVARVEATLAEVGLSDAASRLPGELSGGMRKRVGIARALVTDPRVGLYDEPTAGLDPVTAARILGLLTLARDRRGVAGVAAGHELGNLLDVADRVAMLEDGRLIFEGPVAELARGAPREVQAFVRAAGGSAA